MAGRFKFPSLYGTNKNPPHSSYGTPSISVTPSFNEQPNATHAEHMTMTSLAAAEHRARLPMLAQEPFAHLVQQPYETMPYHNQSNSTLESFQPPFGLSEHSVPMYGQPIQGHLQNMLSTPLLAFSQPSQQLQTTCSDQVQVCTLPLESFWSMYPAPLQSESLNLHWGDPSQHRQFPAKHPQNMAPEPTFVDGLETRRRRKKPNGSPYNPPCIRRWHCCTCSGSRHYNGSRFNPCFVCSKCKHQRCTECIDARADGTPIQTCGGRPLAIRKKRLEPSIGGLNLAQRPAIKAAGPRITATLPVTIPQDPLVSSTAPASSMAALAQQAILQSFSTTEVDQQSASTSLYQQGAEIL